MIYTDDLYNRKVSVFLMCMVKKQRFIVGMLLFVTLILSRTAACAQDTWYNHADTSWYYGAEHATGTSEDPYVITTAEQLAGLAKICNDNINNSKTYKMAEFTGKTIVLDSDIDLKNIEWIPIARLTVFHSDGFNGTFDGRGHTIKNLYISTIENYTSFIKVNGIGLFSNLNKQGIIKNLRIEGSVTTTQSQGAGAVVGYNMYGTLQNIVTSCDVLAASTRADNAVSSGDSETGIGGLSPGGGGANAGRGYAGGLVGVASGGNILNCVVEGTVKSNPLTYSYAGGLVGYASNDSSPLSFFKNCAVLAHSILTKAAVGSGLSMGMLKADSEKCYWLKNNSNDNQPENSGTAQGIKVSAVSEIPVSAVLRGDSLSYNKPANKNFEVELASYPKQSSEGEIKCEWAFKDTDIKIFSVNGLKATILAPTKGVKQFIVKITGINGIAPDDTENSLVLCGSVKVKGAGALITHSAPVTDTVDMSNAAAMLSTKSANGKIELTPEAKISFDAEAASILKMEGSSTGKETVYEKLVAMSPVIRGTITEAGETGIFKIASSDFDYRNANVFFKMTNDGHYCKLSPQSVSSDLYNGEYASDDDYFYIGVDDGGPLDLDGVEDSKIIDPVFAAKIKGAESQSLVTKDSSGGCNGGFSFLALLMLTAVPILLKHRKQR